MTSPAIIDTILEPFLEKKRRGKNNSVTRKQYPMELKIQYLRYVSFFTWMFGIGIVDVNGRNNLSASQKRILTNFPLSPGTPVLLKMAADDQLDDSVAGLRITTNNKNPTADFSVVFYKGHCSAFQYKQKKLPESSRVLQPFADARVAVNYYYADFPLYVAGGNSTITYHLSSTNAPESTKECQLELFLFDDKSAYDKFIDGPTSFPAEGYLNKSGCLPVGKKHRFKNSTVTFSLAEPNSYFVAISSAQEVLTRIRISIQALEFDTKGLHIVDCALNSFTTSCEVSLDDSSKETIQVLPAANSAAVDEGTTTDIAGHHKACVWANASHYVSINATIIKNDQTLSAAGAGDDDNNGSTSMMATSSHAVCVCMVAALVLGMLLCVCGIGLIVTYQVCFLLRPRKHQWWHGINMVDTSGKKTSALLLYDIPQEKHVGCST